MNLFSVIQSCHHLRDAVDQHVTVVDGCKADHVGPDFHVAFSISSHIASFFGVRLGRKGEDRMRHRRHVALGRSVEDITNEEIPLRVSQREKRRPIRFRNFTHHATTIRNFTHQGKGS